MRTLTSLLVLVLACAVAFAQQPAPSNAGDADRDGITDDADLCPDEPEDRDGFQDADGCPDPDNDKDRIPDASDKCPNNAENYNGFEDADGCPDSGATVVSSDTDGDGVSDSSDKCPTQPETKNGYQDQDGCPDAVPRTLLNRTTPHPDYPDWVPPKAAAHFCPVGKSWSASAGACVSNGTVTPKQPASQLFKTTLAAPTGYRCGPGGSLVLNKGCTCAPGRFERRDGDGVAVCAKGAAAQPRPAPGQAPAPAGGLIDL